MPIRNEDISVVMQGPFHSEVTALCLHSLRECLPGSEVIFSTWENEDLRQFNRNDVDVLIFNKDPGSIQLHDIYPYIPESRLLNVNRQIVSTHAGIQKAGGRYVLKIRSDMRLLHDGFKQYHGVFGEFVQDGLRAVEARIVSTDCYHPQRGLWSFFVQDFVFFGDKPDLERLWDLPLLPNRDKIPNEKGFLDCLFYEVPEQYIWLSFLRKKHCIPFRNSHDTNPYSVKTSLLSFVENLVPLEMERFGVESLKYPHWTKEGYIPFTFQWANKFSFSEWLAMYMQFTHAAEGADSLAKRFGPVDFLEGNAKNTFVMRYLQVYKSLNMEQKLPPFWPGVLRAVDKAVSFSGEHYRRRYAGALTQ